jgi:hypothetical protein
MYGGSFDEASTSEIFAAIEQEMTKEDVYLLKLELEGELYEDELLGLDGDQHGLTLSDCKVPVRTIGDV